MKTGISLYLSAPLEQNLATVERAAAAGATVAFTSLHLPEDTDGDFAGDLRELLLALKRAGIELMADVSPRALDILGLERMEDLADLGLGCVRLDFGFSPQRTVELSHTFRIAFNASTMCRADVEAWRAAGADFSRFTACHNFYPKRFTGLDLDDVRRANDRFACMGFEVMGFVPGDGELRAPMFEGLPTVETQRDRREAVALNMLEMGMGAGCDTVIVGDSGLSDAGWEQFEQVSHGFVGVPCELRPGYERLAGRVYHDRADSSALLFRSSEPREDAVPVPVPVDSNAGEARPVGIIAVSNADYLRYEGEIEVSRVDLPGDARMNVAGRVADEALPLLPYVRNGFGLRFKTR